MKIENAELKHIEKIVAISKAAFNSDITVGSSTSGGLRNMILCHGMRIC